MTKNEKRAAAKAAKAVAAAAAASRRRRFQWLSASVTALVVVGLAVAGFVVFGRSGSNHTAGAQPAACSSSGGDAGTPVPSTDPSGGPFPSLPPGADPALAKEPTVTCGTGTLSKLTVKTLIKGTGPAAAAGQTVTVNYVGVSYQTGAEFDASWTRGEPLSFPLGQGKVIPGWDQGLVGVTVGSRVQLDIPSNLAYGDDPSSGGPTGPLRFVVDLLSVA
jgi:peptidylprolyl isomerase